MPDYKFLFAPAASGLDYTIRDSAGISVATGTLESDADVVELVVDLPWGVYEGKAEPVGGPYSSPPAYFANGRVAADGGSGSDLTPTYLEVGSVQLSTASYTPIPWAESADISMREDQFTLDEDTLTCIEAGYYRIDVYLLAGPNTALDTAGPVEVEVLVEVNESTAGPAWNYYPRLHFYAVGSGQKAALSFSLPQILAVDDVITLKAKVYAIGATDLGDAAVVISPTSGALMLTKLA